MRRMKHRRPWKSSKLSQKEVETPAAPVVSQGPDTHPARAGPQDQDGAQRGLDQLKPYRDLETALVQYIPAHLGIQVSDNAWSDLVDKLSHTDAESESQEGLMTLFWWKVGRRGEQIQPWIALIPDSYGLEVVKAGIALVLKLAEHSVEKRDKITNMLANLHDAITTAQFKRKSFQNDPNVSRSANQLYLTLVGAIEDLILHLTPKKSTWSRCIPRLKQNPNAEDINTILQRVRNDTISLERTVGIIRDMSIENTERILNNVQAQTSRIRKDVVDAKVSSREINEKVVQVLDMFQASHEEYIRCVQDLFKRQEMQYARDRDLFNVQLEAVNGLMQNAKADVRGRRVRFQPERPESSRLVNLDHFCAILVGFRPGEGEVSDFDAAFQPQSDLRPVSVQRGRFDPKAHAHMQSILQYSRFTDWILHRYSDMIMVEANIPKAALLNISAASVFCVTFMMSLTQMQSWVTVIHYFAGLHTGDHDRWRGPNGLIRFLILQLIRNLAELRTLSLHFLNKTYFGELARRDTASLCQAFIDLLQQFPSGTIIYCIIDTLSCLDKTEYFEDLEIVLDFLRYATSDNNVKPVLKILVTTPGTYTLRVKELLDRKSIVHLSPGKFLSGGVPSRLIERHIPRSPEPSAARPQTNRRGKQTAFDKNKYERRKDGSGKRQDNYARYEDEDDDCEVDSECQNELVQSEDEDECRECDCLDCQYKDAI